MRPARPEAALEAFYRDFLERHGVRPTAVEAFHEGFNPRGNSERSWLGFVSRMKGLSEAEAEAFSQSRAFLESIEKTETTRSYKIVLLLAMISADTIPGEIGIDELVEQVAKLAARYLKVREDFSVDSDDAKSLRRLLVENPIRAFVEVREPEKCPSFALKAITCPPLSKLATPALFRELLREILDWRLAQYLSRQSSGDANARYCLPGGSCRRSPDLVPSECRFEPFTLSWGRFLSGSTERLTRP